MIVGFTGTQRGMTEQQWPTLWRLLRDRLGLINEFHHGDCIGSDAQAHAAAIEAGYCPILHPPTDPRKRAWCEVPRHLIRPEYPYLTRNRHIVDVSQEMIATPDEFDEQLRSGTWSTIRYARRVGKPVWVILPDGRLL